MNTSYDYQPQRIVVKLRGSNGRSLAMCVAQVHKGAPSWSDPNPHQL